MQIAGLHPQSVQFRRSGEVAKICTSNEFWVYAEADATRGACVLSLVRLFETLWAVAHQAPLSMEFPGQEYWSGLPLLTSGESSSPRTELPFPVYPALADRVLYHLAVWEGLEGHTQRASALK